MVYCDFYLSFEKNERYMSNPVYETAEDMFKLGLLGGNMKYNVWNKLVRRSLYTDNNITFPAGHAMGEDMTMIRLAACAKSIAYVPKAFYHYTQDVNTNSLVKRIKTYEERLLIKEKFCQLMSGHKYYNMCLNMMVTLLVSNSYIKRLFSSDEFKEKF